MRPIILHFAPFCMCKCELLYRPTDPLTGSETLKWGHTFLVLLIWGLLREGVWKHHGLFGLGHFQKLSQCEIEKTDIWEEGWSRTLHWWDGRSAPPWSSLSTKHNLPRPQPDCIYWHNQINSAPLAQLHLSKYGISGLLLFPAFCLLAPYRPFIKNRWVQHTFVFLAVHNSSIGDLVPCLVCLLVRHH